jgi:hypothetical protein
LKQSVRAIDSANYITRSYDENFNRALNVDEANYFIDRLGGELLNNALEQMGKIIQTDPIPRYDCERRYYHLNLGRKVLLGKGSPLKPDY